MENLEVVDRRKVKDEPQETVENVQTLELQPGVTTNQVIIAEAPREYASPVPIFDRILIKKGAAETTWGDLRLVIPEFIQKSPNQGVVVATAEFYIVDGKQFKMDELVKPGDLVTFGQYNVEDITVDGEDYVLSSIFDVKMIHKVTYAVQK